MRKLKFKDGDRMDCKEIREMYKLMFAEYPDIVTVKDCLLYTSERQIWLLAVALEIVLFHSDLIIVQRSY